ncbi:RNA polymerase sigma factor RpoD/SigA [Spirochaetota bacterium]
MYLLERSLLMYLQEINRIPLLSREKEYKLAGRAQRGDETAKKILIEANLRFVVQVANKYKNCGLPMADLINEGNLGLIRAVETFDRKKGFHFISYAVHWIKQSILKAISEKGKLIRLPLNKNNDLLQIDKQINEKYNNVITSSVIEQISKDLNLKKDYTYNLINISRKYISLDSIAQQKSESKQNYLKDFIEDKYIKKPYHQMDHQSLKNNIKSVLSTLTRQEARVIELRFGLTGEESMTLKEIGDLMGLTKERIRQIEKKALSRLKHPSRRNKLKEFIAA